MVGLSHRCRPRSHPHCFVGGGLHLAVCRHQFSQESLFPISFKIVYLLHVVRGCALPCSSKPALLPSLKAVTYRGLELLCATFIFSFVLAGSILTVYRGHGSRNQGSSLKPRVTGNFIHDWWFRIQLNPEFAGIALNSILLCATIASAVSVFFNSRKIKKINFADWKSISHHIFCNLFEEEAEKRTERGRQLRLIQPKLRYAEQGLCSKQNKKMPTQWVNELFL